MRVPLDSPVSVSTSIAAARRLMPLPGVPSILDRSERGRYGRRWKENDLVERREVSTSRL